MKKMFKKGLTYKFFILPLFLVAAILVVSVTFYKSSYSCCAKPIFQDGYEIGATTGLFEGSTVSVPNSVFTDNKNQYKGENTAVLGSFSGEKWIEVDLSEQRVKAWEGDSLFLESLVSTGLPWWPTPVGEFRIWAKARATRMEGGEGKYYYNLPNVPYVMFFENDKIPGYRGYGLHGTYWHNDFGRVHSHGCVNLPTPIAEKLYYWTSPTMPDGKFYVKATNDNLGTRVVIHE